MKISSLILVSIFGLMGCCTKTQKSLVPEKEPVFVSNESTTESREIPMYTDSIVKSLLPNSSTFWLLYEAKLTSWPKDLKEVIQRTICEDSKGGEACQPETFGIHSINDSLTLIIDYSWERSGNSGLHNYVYNSRSKKFVCLAVGHIYGIVKSSGFVGFIFRFNYFDDVTYKSGVYESLEELYDDKVITRGILTQDTFPASNEQEMHFMFYRKEFLTRSVK